MNFFRPSGFSNFGDGGLHEPDLLGLVTEILHYRCSEYVTN